MVNIIRNCYLLFIFNIANNEIYTSDSEEEEDLEMNAIEDDCAYHCDLCGEFTSYSKRSMIDLLYGAVCLTSECIKKII